MEIVHSRCFGCLIFIALIAQSHLVYELLFEYDPSLRLFVELAEWRVCTVDSNPRGSR